MKISKADVLMALQNLTEKRWSREKVSNWATIRYLAENSSLVFVPTEDEMHIRKALEFLVGADLKDSPDTYFHEYGEFEDFMESWSKLCSESGRDYIDEGKE